jgi:anti-sigma B factor antagonist
MDLHMATFDSPSLVLTDQVLDNGIHVIAVSGEIHVTTAPEFSARLNDAIEDAGGVVLDMTEVAFIDSTGLSVLLNGLRRVTRANGRLALVVSNPTVLRLFEVTKLESTFDIQPSLDRAIERVRTAAA